MTPAGLSRTCGEKLIRCELRLDRSRRWRRCRASKQWTGFFGDFPPRLLPGCEARTRDRAENRPGPSPTQTWSGYRQGKDRHKRTLAVDIQLREPFNGSGDGIYWIGLRLQRFLQRFLDFKRNYVGNSKLRADPWNSWQAAVQCSQIRLAAVKPLRDELPRTAIRQHRTRDKTLVPRRRFVQDGRGGRTAARRRCPGA